MGGQMGTTKKVEFTEPVKKPKRGTSPDNPKAILGYTETGELDDGYYSFYFLEMQSKKGGKWGDADEDFFTSKKQALSAAKEARKDFIERERYDFERQNDLQQNRNTFHIRVTAKTTKKQLEAHLEEMKSAIDSLKGKNKQRKEFVEPEYPIYRARKRMIHVTSEEVK